MWTLRDNQDGTWMACHYTVEMVNGKLTQKVLDKVEGTERQALDFMLRYREQISLKELKVAYDMMQETGDDTAQFGVLGGFIMTTNELVSATA